MAKRYKHAQPHKPRQQKANPAYAGMTAITDMPQPRSMPRNYKAYANEGYGSNDTLFKCINYIITNGAAIPPRLYTDRTMKKEITSHPLLDKLDNPNPEQDGVFYRESILGYYLIAGNSFQYAIRTNNAGAPDELWALQPDKIRPIVAPSRGVTGFEYDDFPPEKNPILPEFINHMRSWNPNDPTFGMSIIQVAAILVDVQSALRKWNLALLQNFAKPPGAWTTTALLSPNDRQKLEERVNEKMSGYRNAGKVPVLDGSLKWESSAVSPSELDWQNSDTKNAGRIANLYNIPPEIIGDTSASTYNNMKEAKAASYTEGIFPVLDKMYSGWNHWLVPMYPDLAPNPKAGKSGAYLYYDKKTVEVIAEIIQANLTAASQRGNQAYMQGVAMLDEARVMQGLPPLPNGAGQIFRLGAILVPANQLADYAGQSIAPPPPPDPSPLQGDDEDDEDEESAKPGNNQADDEQEPPEDENNADKDEKSLALHQMVSAKALDRLLATKALDLSTAEEKAAYAASIEASRKRWETQYEKDIANYFEQERKAVVDALNAASSTEALAGKAEAVINDQSEKLKKILLNLYEDVSVDIGGQVVDSLSGKKGIIRDFMNLFGQSQVKYLLTLAGLKIKQVTTTTVAKVRLELTDGVAQGESIPELAKRIDSLYLQQIIPNRSTVIARTEVVASSNYASHEAAGQSGLTLHKVWLATDDSRTRPDHVDADGQEVDMDQPFTVGGDKLMYPGDTSLGASASETVQCRCTQYYKRVQADDTGDDSDTADEKRRARLAYRKFMEATLV